MPYLKKGSDSHGPAPSWSDLGGDLVNETAYHVPRMTGLAGLTGAGLGLGAGALAGNAPRGFAIGGGIGAGGALGAAGGSILGQVLMRLGGPMLKLSPEQTNALMQNANIYGSFGGGALGAAAGGWIGNRLSDHEKK